MPITPDFIERLMLLKLNQAPGVMLDLLGAQAFRAVCVAVKLGVFESLDHGHLTAAEVARRIEVDARGSKLLLEALEALGYVEQRDGRYANASMTTRWLLRRSPTNIAVGIPFFESMVFDRWSHLDESIRRGRPAITGSEWLDQHPGGYRIYEDGMIAAARITADEVVSRVRLPLTAQRLLDVGGGHGLYSIKFCRRYQNLSATVFDLPQALDAARETIHDERMDDRVTVQEGDFWTDEMGAGYDVALLFNIIHAYSPDKNVELLRKVAGTLSEGGLIVIMEQVEGKVSGRAAKALARLQALNFFNDLGGQTYTFNEIAGWLAKAGFITPRLINLRKTPGFSLVLATGRAA
jgi:2-polyprenyl-3-methyl-5-hydroxy-6-metoxy-1,4-benzoquinol methylase